MQTVDHFDQTLTDLQRVQRYDTPWLLHMISLNPFPYDAETMTLIVSELTRRGVVGHSDDRLQAYALVGGRMQDGRLVMSAGPGNTGQA